MRTSFRQKVLADDEHRDAKDGARYIAASLGREEIDP
jgi:hypothetical protein